MFSRLKLSILATAAALATVLAGCGQSGEGDVNAGVIPFVIKVRAADGGYEVDVSGANRGGGWLIPYPGVEAYRANQMLQISKAFVSPDGGSVTLQVKSVAASDVDLMWYTVETNSGAELLTPPQVRENSMGYPIFVMGPCSAGAAKTIVLEVDVLNENGYTLYLDFMEITPRFAYSSNRADPEDSLKSEIYTVRRDGSDRYAVTRDSPDANVLPVWSPGGEWIAMERGSTITEGPPALHKQQVFIVHPDGSNLTRVSKNMRSAGGPTFNPTGQRLIFHGWLDEVSTSGGIFLYDMVADEYELLFSGDDYRDGYAKLPRWSPDGRYLVVEGQNDDAAGAWQWNIAPMDPFTGDSLGPLVTFVKNDDTISDVDGRWVQFKITDFFWAPDSRHACVDCVYLKRYKVSGNWVWYQLYRGLAMIDFDEILAASSLPTFPSYDKITFFGQGPASFPAFNRDGTVMWFDQFTNSNKVDIMYIELSDYLPVTGERLEFIADGYANRTPAAFPRVDPGFFPL